MTTNTQSDRQDEDKPADEEQNIATIVNVIAIVFLIKSNESYGEKLINIANNSVGVTLKPAKINKFMFDSKYNYTRYIDLSEENNNNANITFNNHSIVGIDKIKKYHIQQYLNTTDDSVNLMNETTYSINSRSLLQNDKPTTSKLLRTTHLIGIFPNINSQSRINKNIVSNNEKLQENKVMKNFRKKLRMNDLDKPSMFLDNYSNNNITRQIMNLNPSTNNSLILKRVILKDINESQPIIITMKNNSDKHRLLTNFKKNDRKIKSNEINTNMQEEDQTQDYSKFNINGGFTETLNSMKELKQIRRFKRQALSPNNRKNDEPAQMLPENINIKHISKNINNEISTKFPEELIKKIKVIAKKMQKNKLIGNTGEPELINQLKNKMTIYNGPMRRTTMKSQASHGKVPQNITFEANTIESPKKAWITEQRQNNASVVQNKLINKQNKGTVMYQWQRGAKRNLINRPPRGVTLKAKRQRGDTKLDVEKNNALINKRRRTTIKNKRLKYASLNKGSKGLNIKAIQVKSVESKQQQHVGESTKGEDKPFSICHETFSMLTETIDLIQSSTKTYDKFIINDQHDLMSKQSNQLVLKQHSLSNDELANNFLLSNIVTANTDHLMTGNANNEMPIADVMQPVFQTAGYEIDTQTDTQNGYWPGSYDLENSNTSDSIRRMPFAPSEILKTNRITVKSKKNISTKKISGSGKHSKNSKHHDNKESNSERKHIKKEKHHKKGPTQNGRKENDSKGKKGLQKKKIKDAKPYKRNLKEGKVTKSFQQAMPPKKFDSHKQSNINGKTSGDNVKGSVTKKNEKNIRNVSGVSRHTTDIFARITPNILGKSIDLINRTAELQFRQNDPYLRQAAAVGGVFNSYNNNWNNDNNYYYYASSAITDRNNVNNLIVINFDTTPEPSTVSGGGTSVLEEEEEPEVTCASAVRPTVTFLKRTGFMDYNVVVAALFIGALMLLFLCCCCCAPVIMIRRRRCPPTTT